MTNARTPAGNVPRGRFYVAVGGERLDQIACTAYGRQQGAVEALLAANPGLADLGFTLPQGVAVELPELDLAQGTVQEVSLWS
jgi:phage tail protein X